MNFGFNSNVRVGEATYHVQTEDRGPSHPFLDTVVYLAGRVVYKRSTSYEQFVKGIYPGSLEQKLHERLAQQHREVIAELEAGTLSMRGKEKARPAARAAEIQEGLDLRVLNPKTCFEAGTVNLEIELSDKKTMQRVGGAIVAALLEHGKKRVPCAEGETDDKGSAALKFPLPPNVDEGSSLLVRAREGSRTGELRFRLKSRPRKNKPAAILR